MDFPTIRELSRRKNAVRILKFLMKNNEEQNFTDIWNGLDMNDGTVLYNLTKLQQVGIVEIIRTEVDGRCKYFQISDREFAKRVIDRYHWSVAFDLARLISYDKTEESRVRQDKRFTDLCQELGLSIEEGIKAVKDCPKIGVEESYSGAICLYRKEQGYDKPEEENPKPDKAKMIELARQAMKE